MSSSLLYAVEFLSIAGIPLATHMVTSKSAAGALENAYRHIPESVAEEVHTVTVTAL